jgi:hypothetical protein
MEGTSQTSKAGGSDAAADEPGMSIGPSEEEVEAWAERVRMRRQAWVDGPTEEEKHEWQRRERARRAARLEMEAETEAGNGERKRLNPYEERLRLQRRYAREVRLATEGIGIWAATWPFRVLADLVVTGREWEEDTLLPARRWIPMSDEDM